MHMKTYLSVACGMHLIMWYHMVIHQLPPVALLCLGFTIKEHRLWLCLHLSLGTGSSSDRESGSDGKIESAIYLNYGALELFPLLPENNLQLSSTEDQNSRIQCIAWYLTTFQICNQSLCVSTKHLTLKLHLELDHHLLDSQIADRPKLN